MKLRILDGITSVNLGGGGGGFRGLDDPAIDFDLVFDL